MSLFKPSLFFILISLFFSTASAQLNARIASKEDIAKFLAEASAGNKAKLVFVNDSSSKGIFTMHYVDFSEDPLTIHEIPAAKGGVLPVISPDGEYFVFARGVTGDGEVSQVSTAYICPLKSDGVPVEIASPAYVPRFVQNATVPTVIYSTCSTNPDPNKHSFQGCGAVVKRKFENGTISAPDTVWKGGSYFGGLSWDEKYLATAWLGNGNAIMLDISSYSNKPDTVHLFVKNTATSKDTLLPVGVCNPSISSSQVVTDAMMYFDFGFAIPAGYSNSMFKSPEWAQHQLFFIARANGSVLRVFDQYIPTQYTVEWFDTLSAKYATGQSYSSEWDNPEWSNHPYLATAVSGVQRAWALPDAAGKLKWSQKVHSEHISAINVKDKSYLTLLSSNDSTYNTAIKLCWPWFWAQIPTGFTEDPNWLTTAVRNPLLPHKINQNVSIIGTQIISKKLISSVSLFNLKGALLWKSELPGHKIDFSTGRLSTGTYLIHIQMADKTTVMGKIPVYDK